MRWCTCLILLLSGCNLFGSTPETPDAGTGLDASMSSDLANDAMNAPTDAGDAGDTTDLATVDMRGDLPDSGDLGEEMGGPCMSNRACPIELACMDGACIDRLGIGDTCTESDDCDSGLCATGGVCAELVTPLARYRMDEAAAGTAPTLLRDDTTDPLDLAVAYQNDSGFRVDAEGNRYAHFMGTQTGGSAAIMGTKIEDAFDGGMTGTLEVKSMTLLCEDNQHRVIGMGTGGVPGEDGWFTLREFGGSDYVYVKFIPSGFPTQLRPAVTGCIARAPTVTHVIVDTTTPTEGDRVRMYSDGRRVPLAVDGMAGLPPTLNQGLDIGLPATDRYLHVGRPNPVSGSRTTNQRVWYAAVYAEALPDALVQRNAAQILHNDDAPRGTGIITRTVGMSGDFVSLSEWYRARRGDLTRRFVLRITDTSGEFIDGEEIASPDGCRGRVLAEDRDGTRAEFITLDDFEPGCIEGAVLTGGTSGASARFGGVLLRGTIERAAILDADASGAVLDGSTTDADHYFVVTAATDQLHHGLVGTGAAIQPAADGLLVGVPFTRVERLRIANTPAGSAGLRIEAPDVLVRHALIESSGLDAIQIAADRVVVEDSIVFAASQHGIVHESGDGVVLRNLTIIGIGGAGVQSPGGATAQNIIANGTPAFVSDAAWANASNNISTDATAPGADSQINVSAASLFVSLTPGTEDLHLIAGSAAVDTGTDTGVVSWDVDLEDRDGAWDIGADEL